MSSFFDSLNFPHTHHVSDQSNNKGSASSSSRSVSNINSTLPKTSSITPAIAQHSVRSVRRTALNVSPCDIETETETYFQHGSHNPLAQHANTAASSRDHIILDKQADFSMFHTNQEAHDGDDETMIRDEAPRVFWDVPPSTFIRDWAKANPPDPIPALKKRRGGPEEGDEDERCEDGAWTDRLLRSANTVNGKGKADDCVVNGSGGSRGGKWSRQASTASTSSTTSNSTTCRTKSTSAASGALRGHKGRTSTVIRRSKSLRNSKTGAGFKRHVSSSAVLGQSGVESNTITTSTALDGKGENQTERVNKLLADLGLAFQEEQGRGPDYQDRDEQAPEASMDYTPTVRGGDSGSTVEEDEKTPVKRIDVSADALAVGGASLTPLTLSASQRKTIGVMTRNGGPTSSWERTLTFPLSGSPASGGPQSRTGEAISVVRTIDESEDEEGFGYSDWDEALLVDLPLLSGIEEDQEGYFSPPPGKPSRSQSQSQSQSQSTVLQHHHAISPSSKSATLARVSCDRRDLPSGELVPEPEERSGDAAQKSTVPTIAARAGLSRSPSYAEAQRINEFTSSSGASTLQDPEGEDEHRATRLDRNSASLCPEEVASTFTRSRMKSSDVHCGTNIDTTAEGGLSDCSSSSLEILARPITSVPRQQGSISRPASSSNLEGSKASGASLGSLPKSRGTDRRLSPLEDCARVSTNHAKSAACPTTFYGRATSASSTDSCASPSSRSKLSTTTTSRSLSASGGGLTSRPAGLSRRSLGAPRNGKGTNGGPSSDQTTGSASGEIRHSVIPRTTTTSIAAAAAEKRSPGLPSRVKGNFKIPSRRAAVPCSSSSSFSGSDSPLKATTDKIQVVQPIRSSTAIEGGGGGGDEDDDSFGDLHGFLDGADLDLEEIDKVMSAQGY